MTNSKAWFTKIRAGGVHFCSCYAPPSVPNREFEEFLGNFSDEVRKPELVVIVGDFNVWSTKWDSLETDKRGQNLLEAISYLNLILLNSWGVSTYRKGNSSSIVDLTYM